jgi:hypothetical protein
MKKKIQNQKPTSDSVNHPAHYNSGRIEVIEAIEDWSLTYHEGNAVKYIARAGRKNPDKEVEDLQKAIWYLNRKVQLLLSEQDGVVAPKPDNTPIARRK